VTERLTRTELSWLFAQEARSAAERLRQGVGLSNAPEALPPPPEEGSGGVESTLNRLDDAVKMLATLHGQPVARGRHGKIDIAALVWEIAPEARVQIEMGEGTTVFGDESELRRMLHVLIGQSGEPVGAHAPEMSVRRVGDEVKIGVNLGPDKAPTFEAERQWLSRMAVRYGGRLALEGSVQTLTLLADVDSQKQEVEELRRELAAAQAQGEAYARELAAMVQKGESPTPPVPSSGVPTSSVPIRPSRMPPSADGLVVLVAAARALTTRLRGIHAAINRDIAPLREHKDDVGEIASSVGRHVTAASEIIADLARLGNCPIGELPAQIDVAQMLRDVVSDDSARASRREVTVKLDVPEPLEDIGPTDSIRVLVQAMLEHAVSASAEGGTVVVSAREEDGHIVITFDDSGAQIPVVARVGVMSRDFEALAKGRPSSASLVTAQALAAHLDLPFELDDAPSGGARVRLRIPQPGIPKSG